MSKEKSKSQPETVVNKKESVSVLERIRRRTSLLVGIVGLALLIFILQSLLGSGESIFGGGDLSTVGSINGKKIDRNDFVMRLENQLNNYRQRNQNKDIDDQTRSKAIENIWQQYVAELVIKPQFEKAGISVGEDEIYNSVVVNPVQSVIQQLSDAQTGKLNAQFALPDGSLDLVKWKQAVSNLPADQEPALRSMEENVKSSRYFEKYRNLITKGLYVTSSEAKAVLKNRNTQFSIEYVIKRYESVKDSSIKLSDDEIQKYYNEYSYEFKSPLTTRKIDYVAFNVLPSSQDLADIEKEAQRAATDFKGKTISEDSSFISQESENGNITIQDFTKKTMIVRDSSVFTSPLGTVFGPYNEGAYFKVYKLQAINSFADSAKVRHILIGLNDPENKPKRTKEQAKREADSLLVLIKTKKAIFDTLVKTISDDMGSKTNGGDYGWFDENKGFVTPFKNAGLKGTIGNISVVETQFGYHIIEVLNVSKTRHTNYTIAQIFKLIAPSDETNQAIYAKANQFGGENNTGELFDKAVATQKLTKQMADNIKEGDRQLPGLDQAKELTNWVYTAEKGDVNIFSFNDKHIVAKLSGIKNKGVLPLEDVKEEVTLKAIKQKKSNLFLEEFKNKGNGKNIQEIATKLKLELNKQETLMTESRVVDLLGIDDIFIGTVLGTKVNAISKASVSNNGVFIVKVSAIKTTPNNDFKETKNQLEQLISGRADNDVFEGLKEMSDIEDHKSRIE